VPVQVGEAPDPRLQLGSSLAARPKRPELLGEDVHLVGDLGHERAEEVFLVGEVQIERPV
jgi:hypothetical protein